MASSNNYLPGNMQQAIASMAGTPELPSALPMGFPSTPAPGLPGADPALQAKVLQSLQNPNAGDAFVGPGMAAANTVQPESLLPGSPQDMLAGAAVGSAFGLGLMAINDKWNGFERLAAKIDSLPGIRNISAALDKRVANAKNAGMREWLMRDAIEKGVPTAVANMERRQLAMMAKGNAKMPAVQNLLSKHKTFAGAQAALEAKIAALEKKSLKAKLSKDEYKLLKAYRGAFHSIKGMHSYTYSNLFAQQAAQQQRLAAKGVGPIGRSIASMSLYTQRIFAGDTLKGMMGNTAKIGEAGASKWLGRLLPSAFGGAFIFGSAISKARKAEEGEKVSTFMHDFLGVGLGSFIGWEVGQKLLTAIGFRGFLDKIGHKIGIGNISNRLLTPGRGLLEKFVSPATVTKITKFLPKLTFGGFGVGVIGMFVFGSIFQKIFEKISNSIFGKPSEASLQGKGNTENQQHGAISAMIGGGSPAVLGNPTFSSFQTPSMMASATPFSLSPDQIRVSAAANQSSIDVANMQRLMGL
jgi:hypothetical protein